MKNRTIIDSYFYQFNFNKTRTQAHMMDLASRGPNYTKLAIYFSDSTTYEYLNVQNIDISTSLQFVCPFRERLRTFTGITNHSVP